MEKLNTFLSIIVILAGGVVGAAAIFALFRSRYIKATVEELRGDRDDQAKRIERLEKENNDLKAENAKRDAIIETLKGQNSTLKEALSGKAQLNHLQEQLDNHDRRVDERHDRLVSEMDKVVYSNATLLESNQTLVDSNQYLQAALLDFLKKQDAQNV